MYLCVSGSGTLVLGFAPSLLLVARYKSIKETILQSLVWHTDDIHLGLARKNRPNFRQDWGLKLTFSIVADFWKWEYHQRMYLCVDLDLLYTKHAKYAKQNANFQSIVRDGDVIKSTFLVNLTLLYPSSYTVRCRGQMQFGIFEPYELPLIFMSPFANVSITPSIHLYRGLSLDLCFFGWKLSPLAVYVVIFIKRPNHLIFCFSMYCRHGIVPTSCNVVIS